MRLPTRQDGGENRDKVYSGRPRYLGERARLQGWIMILLPEGVP